jgi:hypothetical protein
MLRALDATEGKHASAENLITLDSRNNVQDYETLLHAMAERRLVILKHSGKTPALAMCERCRVKFFTPRELTYLRSEAEGYIWQRFNSHECKHVPLQLIRKA